MAYEKEDVEAELAAKSKKASKTKAPAPTSDESTDSGEGTDGSNESAKEPAKTPVAPKTTKAK